MDLSPPGSPDRHEPAAAARVAALLGHGVVAAGGLVPSLLCSAVVALFAQGLGVPDGGGKTGVAIVVVVALPCVAALARSAGVGAPRSFAAVALAAVCVPAALLSSPAALLGVPASTWLASGFAGGVLARAVLLSRP